MTLRVPFRRFLRTAIPAVLPVLSAPLVPAFAQPVAHIVISEVYGGGGNSGALYTHDFIELYNPTGSDVAMSQWSVQYQAGGATGPFTAVAKFSGVIRSHGFFLIQGNPGSGGTLPLPSPDAVAGISMAAASGKVALASDTLSIGGPSDTAVVDFVGYGSANLFEGSGPAAAPGNTKSVERKATVASDEESMVSGGSEEHSGNGRDSDDNLNDFIRRDPDPQNDASGTEGTGGSLSLTVPYGMYWNMVSLPVGVPDPSAAVLFPGAMTPLYRYQSGYVAETSAVPGAGYWVRFAMPETAAFTGEPFEPETLTLEPGWNLIGTIASVIGVDHVVQMPDGHLTGDFYEYAAGYRRADSLRPGRGYWVRSGTGGSLVLGTGGGTANSPAPGMTNPTGQTPGSGRVLPADRPSGIEPPALDADLPPDPPGGTLSPVIDAHPAESPGARPSPPDDAGPAQPGFTGVFPNPFNPATKIGFFLPRGGHVELSIYDLSGRRVAVLMSGDFPPGHHSAAWDARTGEGFPVSCGIYLALLETGGIRTLRTLMHMK